MGAIRHDIVDHTVDPNIIITSGSARRVEAIVAISVKRRSISSASTVTDISVNSARTQKRKARRGLKPTFQNGGR